MSDDLIERLRNGLEGATPGEWEVGSGWVFVDPKDGYRTSPLRHILRDVSAEEIQSNCEFIVAAQPENIRALLDALAAKDTAISEMRAELDALKSGASAILPQTKKHAEDLYTVAVACLKSFGDDPEAQLERATALAELRQRMLDEALFELEAYRSAARALSQDEPADLGVGG